MVGNQSLMYHSRIVYRWYVLLRHLISDSTNMFSILLESHHLIGQVLFSPWSTVWSKLRFSVPQKIM